MSLERAAQMKKMVEQMKRQREKLQKWGRLLEQLLHDERIDPLAVEHALLAVDAHA